MPSTSSTCDSPAAAAADMYEPYVLTGADWPAELAVLRSRGPIARILLPGGVAGWSVTDTDTLRMLMSDPRVSKDAYAHWSAMRDGQVTEAWPMWLWASMRNMLTTDGVEHHRLRRIVSPAFTNRRIEALRPRIAEISTALLDDLATTTGDHEIVDLRETFVNEVPIQVICALMGVPPDLAAQLCGCVTGILDTSLTPGEVHAQFGLLYQVLGELIAYKRGRRGEDVTSTLLTAHDRGELTDAQLLDTLMLLIAAGYETTTHLLDQAIVAVLRDPGLHAHMLAGTVSWEAVIEETLRAQPPIPHMPFRYAITDIDLGDGYRIARGDLILVCLAAVGRDPGIHTDPEVFDPDREFGAHLAFGHGPHVCLGAALARLEASIALPALFARFPGMRLNAVVLEPISSILVNGHREVPVVRGPARTDPIP